MFRLRYERIGSERFFKVATACTFLVRCRPLEVPLWGGAVGATLRLGEPLLEVRSGRPIRPACQSGHPQERRRVTGVVPRHFRIEGQPTSHAMLAFLTNLAASCGPPLNLALAETIGIRKNTGELIVPK
jgi:hypothetical protein